MINFRQLCPGCFRDAGGQEPCPFCGYTRNRPQSTPLLTQGADVAGRYIIGNKLYAGGDGVTYIAWDMDTERVVRLREFLPQAIASRETVNGPLRVLSGCEKIYEDCLISFERMWDKLIKLRGLSSLISVRELVRDYGTLYAVIDGEEMVTLDAYLNMLPTRRLSWNALRPPLMPLLNTMETLHKAGLVHAGISPSAIFVSRDGRFFIGDFGIVQARCSVGDLTAELHGGYAAAEQYGARQKVGTWTDVYALAAVIYRCLIGVDPIPASQRMVRDELMIPGEIARTLPPYVTNAIIDALQIKPENRTAELEELRAGLAGREFRKRVYPLSFYNYDDINYINQDKKPYIPPQQYYAAGSELPKPADRGNITRPKQSGAMEDAPADPPSGSGGSKKSGPIAFFIVVLLIGIAAFVYFAFFSDIEFFRSTPETTVTQTAAENEVPNLLGRTDVSLKSDAALREKFALVYQQEYSVDVAKGYVIRQSVPEGTMLPEGSELVIVISMGPQDLPIPNVIDQQAQAAREQLEKLGFVVQVVERTNDGTAPEGLVASVTPEVGTVYTQGQTVQLFVWGAPPTTEPPTTDAPGIFGGGGSGSGSGGLFSGGLFDLFR